MSERAVKATYRWSDTRPFVGFERDIEIEMDTQPYVDGDLTRWKGQTYRQVTITLAGDQRWPSRLKRGVPIKYDVAGQRFVGKVITKRGNVLVCGGRFV